MTFTCSGSFQSETVGSNSNGCTRLDLTASSTSAAALF